MPTSTHLQQPNVMNEIVQEIQRQYIPPAQTELPGLEPQPAPDIKAIVKQAVIQLQKLTIDIPRIVVVPTGVVSSGFDNFQIDTTNVHFQPVDRDLLIRSLQNNEQESLSTGNRVASETRLEDYIVRQLIDFSDISYDNQADLLYELAGQMVRHLESYLVSQDEVLNVVVYYQRQLANLIHSQMQAHRWEKNSGYEVNVTRGFMALKESAFTSYAAQPIQDFHVPPADKNKINQIIFGGFTRCLYPVQKFQSDTERKLAIILDHYAEKWFKPALGQFQIYYAAGVEQLEYQPDFVAEVTKCIYMLEPKASREVDTPIVQAKRDAAVTWCKRATDHALEYGGKPWQYALIPHDAITENMTLEGLIAQYSIKQNTKDCHQ